MMENTGKAKWAAVLLILVLQAVILACSKTEDGDSGTDLLLALRLAARCRNYATKISAGGSLKTCNFDSSSLTYSCAYSTSITAPTVYKYASIGDFVDEVRPIGLTLHKTETKSFGPSITQNTFSSDKRLLTSVTGDGARTITYTAWDASKRVTQATQTVTGTNPCAGISLGWVYDQNDPGDPFKMSYGRDNAGATGAGCGSYPRQIYHYSHDANGNRTFLFRSVPITEYITLDYENQSTAEVCAF